MLKLITTFFPYYYHGSHRDWKSGKTWENQGRIQDLIRGGPDRDRPKTAILGSQFVEFWCWGLIFGGQGGPGPWGPPGSAPENGKAFSSQGKVREFCQDWKSQGILLKILEKLEKLYWKIEKNTGKVREICQPVKVKTPQIWYHTLNKTKELFKILENCKKYWKSQGNLSVRKMWEPCTIYF